MYPFSKEERACNECYMSMSQLEEEDKEGGDKKEEDKEGESSDEEEELPRLLSDRWKNRAHSLVEEGVEEDNVDHEGMEILGCFILL